MGDPVTLVESATSPVVTAIPTVIAGEMQDGAKTQSANKNGKKADSGSSSGSFFTWFIVLALLGVWTSVAVVYFDLVDYQGVLGKLVAYDTDGDGDFDVEDAKVLLAEQTGVHEERKRRSKELPVPRFRRRERKKAGTRGTKILAGMRAASLGLDENPGAAAKRGAKKETPIKDVGSKLREALKQQLAIIHERVEAKKLAKLALAEVREILAKEEEAKELELGRKEISARVKERVATRLKEEEEKIEKEEMEKALEKLRKEKAKPLDEKEEEGKDEKEGEKKSKKGGEKDDKSEKKMEGEGKKAQEEDKGRGKESAKEKRKKSDRGGKN